MSSDSPAFRISVQRDISHSTVNFPLTPDATPPSTRTSSPSLPDSRLSITTYEDHRDAIDPFHSFCDEPTQYWSGSPPFDPSPLAELLEYPQFLPKHADQPISKPTNKLERRWSAYCEVRGPHPIKPTRGERLPPSPPITQDDPLPPSPLSPFLQSHLSVDLPPSPPSPSTLRHPDDLFYWTHRSSLSRTRTTSADSDRTVRPTYSRQASADIESVIERSPSPEEPERGLGLFTEIPVSCLHPRLTKSGMRRSASPRPARNPAPRRNDSNAINEVRDDPSEISRRGTFFFAANDEDMSRRG